MSYHIRTHSLYQDNSMIKLAARKTQGVVEVQTNDCRFSVVVGTAPFEIDMEEIAVRLALKPLKAWAIPIDS